MSFEARLAQGTPLPPCTSSTRRADIGGLPPRVGVPCRSTGDGCRRGAALGQRARSAQETRQRARPSSQRANAARSRREKIDRLRRALASGAALRAVLGPDGPRAAAAGRGHRRQRPARRMAAGRRRRGGRSGEKTLVFARIARRSRCCGRRSATAPARHRRLPRGADAGATRHSRSRGSARPRGQACSISTECGGEGRNFEFCRRLVLFDLPWNPAVVEQRIGRLDRIGRRIPVEIVYSGRPAASAPTSRGCSKPWRVSRAARGTRAAAGPRRRRPRGDRRSIRQRRSRPTASRARRPPHAARTRIQRSGVSATPPRAVSRRDGREPSSRACPRIWTR